MELNFTQDVKLNRLHLDVAAEQQAGLMGRYGSAVAEAQKARDEAENRLELRSGELWIELRTEQVNGKAATADDVKNMVAKHPEVSRLKQELADAGYNLKLSQAEERAINANKDMIETLQRLHGASYFATPTASSGRENLPGYRPSGT
jgi:hypothetical protein